MLKQNNLSCSTAPFPTRSSTPSSSSSVARPVSRVGTSCSSSTTPLPRSCFEGTSHDIQTEVHKTVKRVALERRQLQFLERGISKVENVFGEKHLEYAKGNKEGTTDVQKARANLALMQSHLEQGLTKLNKIIDSNNKIRQDIDNKRAERITMTRVFEQLHKEMESTFAELKEYEKARIRAGQSEPEALQQIRNLRIQRDEQRRRHKQRLVSLQTQIKVQEATNKKNDIHSQRELDALHKLEGKHYVISPEDEEQFSQEILSHNIVKTFILNIAQRRHIQKLRQKIALFDKGKKDIQAFTGISNIDDIVRIFLEMEESNYSLITYVNSMNQEIESLEKGSRLLVSLVDDHYRHEVEADEQKRQARAEIEDELSKTSALIRQQNIEIQKQDDSLSHCRIPVLRIYERIKNAWTPKEGSKPPAGIENENVMLPMLHYIERFFLGCKDEMPGADAGLWFDEEDRPSNLVAFLKQGNRHLRGKRDGKKHPGTLPSKNSMAALRSNILIRPTELPSSTSQDSEEEDLGLRPLSREELTERTLKGLMKKSLEPT